MKEHILVTGGAGFIGSFVCQALFEAGFLPVTFDNLSIGKKEAVRFGPLIEGDLLNKKEIFAACKRVNPTAIIHLAALSIVAESFLNPALYYTTNVVGTLNLLEVMHQTGISNLIYSSSAAVYGDPKTLFLEESHPTIPLSPYGRSKLMAEEIIQDFEKAYGIASVILRYFNAAGADPHEMLGEDHTPETHLIPLLIDSVLKVKPPVAIFGNSLPTKDGTAIRDYVHAKDLALGHVKALFYLLKHRGLTILNLGSGAGSSIKELLETLSLVIGKDCQVIYKSPRNGEPAQLVANCTKAQKLLNWNPLLSSKEIIIKSVLEYKTKRMTTNLDSIC